MSEIDSETPPPVKSLKSRFEDLAHRHGHGFHHGKNASLEVPTPQPSLRPSTSATELKKRPPPPPPSRGSKAMTPSPTGTPLRTVPALPSVTATSTPSPPNSISRRSSSSMQDLMGEDAQSIRSVSSLRNKFSNSSLSSFPASKPNIHGRQTIHRESSVPNITTSSSRPALPPRPNYLSPSTIAKSASSSRTSLFSTDEEESPPRAHHIRSQSDIIPPPLPSRARNSTVRPGDYHSHNRGGSTSSSSSGSFDSDFSGSPVSPSVPSASSSLLDAIRRVPPPPPVRAQSSSSLSAMESPTAGLTSPPPPLPVRRIPNPPSESPEETRFPTPTSAPPPLPVRPASLLPAPRLSSPSSPPRSKVLNSYKLPPPPTRTIALGDKLPVARRPPSPSDPDSSSDEEEQKEKAAADLLPDSSRSSRSPPFLMKNAHWLKDIQVPAYAGHAVISGDHLVISTHHHVKLHDMTLPRSLLHNLSGKDVGLKELKPTAMGFRHTDHEPDKGCLLWVGTKEGHLLEIDVRTGTLMGTKLSAHGHPVTHIFRYGASMITLDNTGKLLIFTPESRADLKLPYTQPRVYRASDKQEFTGMLGGLLWTSCRSEMTGLGLAKTPVIRVYDIFSPGSTGKTLLLPGNVEHVGAITSGTMLSSQPGLVYLGHEGGYISIWETITEDGFPKCLEVMKVSTSDVLALEGVNDRLWVGGRKGMITTYNVVPRPWVVTNCWSAHNELPVMSIKVDTLGILKTGKLRVMSVGRDEQVKFWDGLLGSDWIDQELMKREHALCNFHKMKLLVISWNVDAAKPDALNGDPANINFLSDALTSVESPDIIAFGFQEVIDLESRKMTAKNVLLGPTKKRADGGLSDHVTHAYKRWYDRLVLAVRMAMPADCPYTVVHTESLVGLFSCVFAKKSMSLNLQDVAITTIKRGMKGRYGNKGGIVSRFVIDDTSFCIINCHLAAGQSHVRQRNADIAAFLEDSTVLPTSNFSGESVAYVGGGDGSMILDHEMVFVAGDMNYRIDQRRDPIINAISSNDLSILYQHDQLIREIKHNRGFRFRDFEEGPLLFAPTYKYDRRSSEYDTSEKRRTPAWCDRVLWRSRVPARVQQLHYKRYEANVSDHRPISAGFEVTVKMFKHDARTKAKLEVLGRWDEEQVKLLKFARDFYVGQALI